MHKLSLIIPCYNEEEMLYKLYDEIITVAKTMHKQKFEFLFIDDGSTDDTLLILKKLYQIDERVRFISFSKNFGKEAALYAGLQHAQGDFVAVLDADLQDPPELIPSMYQSLIEDGFDCVATRRDTRQGEPPIRSFFARFFYKIMDKISHVETVDGARDFRLMTRKMVDAVISMSEYNRFSKGIFGWVGFRTKWISYHNIQRAMGATKWSFWKLFIYGLDGITAFSTAPLIMASLMGGLFCLIAFMMMMIFIIKTLLYGDHVAGYPSLVSIILFVSGVQLFCLGIMGQYLSKIYLETKQRPIYIISQTEKDQAYKQNNENFDYYSDVRELPYIK